jgi:DNA anti-recombination protein RmuC
MGAVVFDNHVFDSWLTKKSDEILSKVDRETISTEEMLTLILKAQTNHFHHMDVEFREEFKAIRNEMNAMETRLVNMMWDSQESLRSEVRGSQESLRTEVRESQNNLRTEIREAQDALRSEIKESQDMLRTEMKESQDMLRTEMKEFQDTLRTEMKESQDMLRSEMKTGFDKFSKYQMWFIGILMTAFSGIYLKLFLG